MCWNSCLCEQLLRESSPGLQTDSDLPRYIYSNFVFLVHSCANVVNVILDVRSTRKTVRVVAGRSRAVVSNQSVSVALAGVLSRLPGAPQLPEAAPAAQRHPHHPAQLFRVPQAAQLAVVEALH